MTWFSTALRLKAKDFDPKQLCYKCSEEKVTTGKCIDFGFVNACRVILV